MSNTPFLFILCGPTCAGKTTIAKHVNLPNLTWVSATYTTRPPREGEKEGVDYYFVNDDWFVQHEGQLLEYAHNHGYQYGTTHDLIPKDKDALIIFDIKAALRTREKKDKVVIIFLDASLEDIAKRLNDRHSSVLDCNRRMSDAVDWKHRSYAADYIIQSVHGQIDRMTDELEAIIKAERLATHWNIYQ